MSTTRKHHLNLASPAAGDEYHRQIEAAESQLQKLQQKREEIEHKRLEEEAITNQRQNFIDGQIELLERLEQSVQAVDREIFESRQALKELEEARKTFAGHLQTLQNIDPRKWKKTRLVEDLQNAMEVLEACENDYEEIVATISEGRGRGFLAKPKTAVPETFRSTLCQGLAFNFPLIVLATIALLVFLAR